MPRRADHDARRLQVLAALVRCALRTGVHDLGYRDVASEAGVSVRLVQYYFPSRHELLLAGLEHVRRRITARIDERLDELPDPSDVRARLTVVLEGLLPVDEDGRDLTVVHHAFGALALTDPTIPASPFSAVNRDLLTTMVGTLTGLGISEDVVEREAAALIGLATGLGVGVVFGQFDVELARSALHHHLDGVLSS
ncbi:TetR/AcrR family transcriptional regulator [Actinomycetospora sp. CA-053990]|uniref:TetR/AcrR family transcriptional regulator n=1 Tax=Actinomycetospora sp. CA-053990 TaxID=3239891 RepID=UPI003D8F1CE1